MNACSRFGYSDDEEVIEVEGKEPLGFSEVKLWRRKGGVWLGVLEKVELVVMLLTSGAGIMMQSSGAAKFCINNIGLPGTTFVVPSVGLPKSARLGTGLMLLWAHEDAEYMMFVDCGEFNPGGTGKGLV